ncbi:uncharacterized protein A1O5_05486 [Cladophialophora psammophila CBS 110553]|uniref:Uncharacterized protein n=1 Tax=Cladophialophora psammophila CBS 110553 TaxID=1182543 RepID=W9WUM8_9EURO|nr:uncharacterized protein A1O5_05486 [Cladophialophora psammophila CBS 110553]EXJ71678.1 hypothetical protein A1O5_05486 [Cladophialophora psammophila CBS 110553]
MASSQRLGRPTPHTTGPTPKHFSTHNTSLITSCCMQSATCIHRKVAAALQNIEAISHLCKEDFDKVDVFGDGILHIAARYGATFDVLGQLLAQSSTSNRTNIYGESFLHLLDQSWLTDKVDHFHRLLAIAGHQGFRYHSRDRHGRTFLAMFLADDRLCTLTIPQLLDALEAVLSSDERWLKVALLDPSQGWPRLIDRLKALIERVLQNCVAASDFPIVRRCSAIHCRLLDLENAIPELSSGQMSLQRLPLSKKSVWQRLQAGDDPDSYDENGHTWLMRIVQNISASKISPQDGAELLKILLRAGADVRKRDPMDQTVLHHAASLGEHTAVNILIEHGADVNARNLLEQKPVNLATDALGCNPRHPVLAPKLYQTFQILKAYESRTDSTGLETSGG